VRQRPTVSVVLVHSILRAAQERGASAGALLAEARIPPAVLDDPDGLVTVRQEEALWEAAVRRFGATVGLDVALSLGKGTFRALEYAVRSSATFRQGLERLVRFDHLLHGLPLFTTEPAGDGVCVVYAAPHAGHSVAPVAGDFALASIVVIGRDAVNLRWCPSMVWLGHPPPPHDGVDRYERVFGCPVTFSAPRYALEVPRDILDQPMREADPALNALLTGMLESTSAPGNSNPDVAHAVRERIVSLLPDDEPTLAAVAASLGVSPRTLQKRLAAQDSRFQDLAREVRAELAKGYLEQEGTTLAGVALLLGYSELSAFVRAFKQATGVTPGEYRRQVRDGRA
jgi:AraC-like DNA-binding protein